MKKKIVIVLIVIFLIIIVASNIFGEGWLIYHEGAFKGKIIDTETKQPIEGAVIVAKYNIRVCGPVFIPECGSTTIDVKEVVTNNNGEFNISPHTFFYLWPFTLGKEDSSFVIYKPSYRTFDEARLIDGTPLSIFAIGSSTIDYLELGKVTVDGHTTALGDKKTKTYPEGLIFSGDGCREIIDSLKKSTPFMIDYIFSPLEGAREKIKRLEIPLDCPKDGEPVPAIDQTYNFRNDIEEYINKSFVIIELSKLRNWDERNKASMISISDIPKRKWPLLNNLIEKEEEWLKQNKDWIR